MVCGSRSRLLCYGLNLCRVEARSGYVMELLAPIVPGASEEALFEGAKAPYRLLVELGDTSM